MKNKKIGKKHFYKKKEKHTNLVILVIKYQKQGISGIERAINSGKEEKIHG